MEECLSMHTLLSERQGNNLTHLVERAHEVMAMVLGTTVPSRRYERQRDYLLRLSNEYQPLEGETSSQVLRRFLDGLSPVLHPNCDTLEENAGQAARVTLTTAEAAMGRQWRSVIALTGEELLGRGDGLKNLRRAASRARNGLLIVVPPLRTAGRNDLIIGMLESIFGDTCTVQRVGVAGVENMSTPTNAGMN